MKFYVILSCNYTNKTADGAQAFIIPNNNNSWYWSCRQCSFPRCVWLWLSMRTGPVYCVILCYVTGWRGMSEESSEVLTDRQCLSVPLNRIANTPAMMVQSLSVILINGISHLLQWCLSLKSPVKVSAYYCQSTWQVERIREHEREMGSKNDVS